MKFKITLSNILKAVSNLCLDNMFSRLIVATTNSIKIINKIKKIENSYFFCTYNYKIIFSYLFSIYFFVVE